MGGLQPMKGQIRNAGDLTPLLCLTLKQYFPLRAIYFVANSFPIVFIIRPRVVFHTLLVTIWKCTSFGNVYRISSFEFCISDVIYFDERTKRKFVKVLKTVHWFCVNKCKEEIVAVNFKIREKNVHKSLTPGKFSLAMIWVFYLPAAIVIIYSIAELDSFLAHFGRFVSSGSGTFYIPTLQRHSFAFIVIMFS